MKAPRESEISDNLKRYEHTGTVCAGSGEVGGTDVLH